MAPLPARRTAHNEDVQNTDRMRAASAKARAAFFSVAQRAREVSEEIDDATGVHVVTAELHEEDSAVIVVREMMTSLAPKTA